MTEPRHPFDVILDAIRQAVREEIAKALAANAKPLTQKDWLKASECSELYGLRKTFFEEKGRAGEIGRTKPGKYVLFDRRDVENYLEKHKK
jgi:excisionase family DNA binding protein